MKKYKIGDIIIRVKDEEYVLKENKHIKQFCEVEKTEEIEYQIIMSDLKELAEGSLIQRNGLYELYQTSKGAFVLYHWMTTRFAYGFYLKDLEKNDIIPCYVNHEMKNCTPLEVSRVLSSTGLHSKLLQNGALVFHASYVEWQNQAILFAGSSGTGKSTQADLWNKQENAEIINGDRALLKKKDGVWYSYGYPSCGSSDICVNITLPLKAIVLLEQGEKNCVDELSLSQKMRMLLSGSEMYLWNAKEVERVYQITQELCADEIPIFKLICRPDVDAVRVLKEYLQKG